MERHGVLRQVSKVLSVMLWWCIGPNFIGKLIICDRNTNAEEFVCLLHGKLFSNVHSGFGIDDRLFIAQQSNAPSN